MSRTIAAWLMLLLAASVAEAANETVAGELTVDPPTLMALGFAWAIEGDDNRNAQVSIAYREKGKTEWRRGLDLLRLQKEEVYMRGALDYTAPNMFAGSLFDLREDTEYEVRLRLQDPDGVKGEAEKNVTVRTRAEPRPAAGGRIFHVYPPGFKGEREEPAFSGLLEAYYMASLGGDWSRASQPRGSVRAIIKVHAGLYLSKRDHYRDHSGSHMLRDTWTARTTSPRTAPRNALLPSSRPGTVK